MSEILRKYKKLFAIAVCAMFVWVSGVVVVSGLQMAYATPPSNQDERAVQAFLLQLENPDLPHDPVTNLTNADKLNIDANDMRTWGQFFTFNISRRLTHVERRIGNSGTAIFIDLHGKVYFPGCTSLVRIMMSSVLLTEIDVSTNTSLTLLSISGSFEELDVSNNPALTEIRIYASKLINFNVSNKSALSSISVVSSNMQTFDISNNPTLTYLDVGSGSLQPSNLNVSNNPALIYMSIFCDTLETFDVSSNLALESLWITGGKFSSFDVSNHPALRSLNISNSDLEFLDVSGAVALEFLSIITQ